MDEKDVTSLSLIDAVIQHATLAQRPSQTKVESSDGQQTSSDGDRTTEGENETKNKRDNTGSILWLCIIQFLFLSSISVIRAYGC